MIDQVVFRIFFGLFGGVSILLDPPVGTLSHGFVL